MPHVKRGLKEHRVEDCRWTSSTFHYRKALRRKTLSHSTSEHWRALSCFVSGKRMIRTSERSWAPVQYYCRVTCSSESEFTSSVEVRGVVFSTVRGSGRPPHNT